MSEKEYVDFLEKMGTTEKEIDVSVSLLSECSCGKHVEKPVDKNVQYNILKNKLNKIKENLSEMMKVYQEGYGTSDIVYESSIDFDTNKKIAIDYLLYSMNAYEKTTFQEKSSLYFKECGEDEKKDIVTETLYKLLDELKIVDDQTLLLREMIGLNGEVVFEGILSKRLNLQKRLEENMKVLIDSCKKEI